LQSTLAAAALVLPMMRVAEIETRMPVGLFLPRILGTTEPVRQTSSRSGVSRTMLTQPVRSYKPFQAPSRIPSRIEMGPDLPGAPVYAIGDGGGAGGVSGPAILSELTGRLPLDVPPPAPRREAAPIPAPQAPITVGSGVQAAKLVFGPKPVYPPIARQARISGAVQLAARISADGHIRDLRVVSGHPMLIAAALEAVRQWVYQPTLLNGQAVEVLTQVEVNFVLQ
jgi:protein TonB